MTIPELACRARLSMESNEASQKCNYSLKELNNVFQIDFFNNFSLNSYQRAIYSPLEFHDKKDNQYSHTPISAHRQRILSGVCYYRFGFRMQCVC